MEAEVLRCSTADKVIDVLAKYADQEDTISLEFITFNLLKVVPRIYKSSEFETYYFSVFELACLKAEPYDFFTSIMQTLPSLIKD